jgi:hypothetical protein
LTPGNAACSTPGSVRKRQALPIVRVKAFDFEGGLFRLGEQNHATIGHRAVYIPEEHFNLSSAFLKRWGYLRLLGQANLRTSAGLNSSV